jgi:hypothetical protein
MNFEQPRPDTLEFVGAQPPAIERNKPVRLAGAAEMNHACQMLLAGSGFPFEQDERGCLPGQFDLGEHLPQGHPLGHKAARTKPGPQRPPRRGDFGVKLPRRSHFGARPGRPRREDDSQNAFDPVLLIAQWKVVQELRKRVPIFMDQIRRRGQLGAAENFRWRTETGGERRGIDRFRHAAIVTGRAHNFRGGPAGKARAAGVERLQSAFTVENEQGGRGPRQPAFEIGGFPAASAHVGGCIAFGTKVALAAIVARVPSRPLASVPRSRIAWRS